MKYFSRNKYLLLVNAIGITVAFTMNFPELIALFSPEEANTVYPGLNWTQVGSEVLFTYLSIIILFWLNRIIFRFNGESIELSTKLFFRANRQFLISRKAIKDISLWFNGKSLSARPRLLNSRNGSEINPKNEARLSLPNTSE